MDDIEVKVRHAFRRWNWMRQEREVISRGSGRDYCSSEKLSNGSGVRRKLDVELTCSEIAAIGN